MGWTGFAWWVGRVAKTCRPCGPVGAIFSGRCYFLGKAREKTANFWEKHVKNC